MTSAWTWSCVACFEERPDPADIVEGKSAELGVQDSLSSKITPRVLPIDKGDTVTSSTMIDRSMWGQSLPGIKRSSVLWKLSLRWCAVVQVAMTSWGWRQRCYYWCSFFIYFLHAACFILYVSVHGYISFYIVGILWTAKEGICPLHREMSRHVFSKLFLHVVFFRCILNVHLWRPQYLRTGAISSPNMVFVDIFFYVKLELILDTVFILYCFCVTVVPFQRVACCSSSLSHSFIWFSHQQMATGNAYKGIIHFHLKTCCRANWSYSKISWYRITGSYLLDTRLQSG